MGAQLKPKPSDLTDATGSTASTDGEIFTVIRDGVKGTRACEASTIDG